MQWQDGDMEISVLVRKDYDSNGRRNSRGSQLAHLAVHQKGRVQGLSGQTFYQCDHEEDDQRSHACIFKTKPASSSRLAQQVEGDDQLRS